MRPWVVIPVAGAIGAAAGAVIGGVPLAIGFGFAAAAIASAGRALMGDSPAAIAGAAVASLLAIATFADSGTIALREVLAAAALAWTITELQRAVAPESSPLVAMLPAITGAILSPTLIPLVPIAGYRLVTAPWRRPRWIVALPIAGTLAAVIVAIVEGSFHPAATAVVATDPAAIAVGPSGHPAFGASSPIDIARMLLALLGPFVVVASIAGLPSIAGRARYVQLAILSSLVLAIALGAHAPMIALAALLSSLAIGRLAGAIRIPFGQAVLAGTIGAIVVLPPAWSTVEHQVVSSRT